ncbi:sodium/proton antiporter NhaB [Nitrococcus mobilis]|nr:sodium/proton antiporter NhaB [Nitrococcus mobilis]
MSQALAQALPMTLAQAFVRNFLGQAPNWYKLTIIGFLITNPVLLSATGPYVTGWALVLEFIFTLAMALKCYPLQPGGLLLLEATGIGLTSPEQIYHEALQNFPVILLLMFMVAGIYFLRDLLLITFTRILLGVRSKSQLALLFCGVSAILSAFLDALTVTAVIITVAGGFYAVYHRAVSGQRYAHEHDRADDTAVDGEHRIDLERFRAFLRSLMMHGAIGTALGGVMTLVGEPQNLLIGHIMGWQFIDFFLRMAPVAIPVFISGLIMCIALERCGWFGYGATLPPAVRRILEEFEATEHARRGHLELAMLIVQALAALLLVLALSLQLAEVGLIGLAVIILATAFNGITEEHRLGHAFEEALPFTALLVVFFGVVAVIHQQHLFTPILHWALAFQGNLQQVVLFLASGLLSMISDNVFVATIYIDEIKAAFDAGQLSVEQFNHLAVAINTGTNIPSIATPNGQAAFLFLLTSTLAPLIRLSYGRMLWMALPYTIVLGTTALACAGVFI